MLCVEASTNSVPKLCPGNFDSRSMDSVLPSNYTDLVLSIYKELTSSSTEDSEEGSLGMLYSTCCDKYFLQRNTLN